MIWGLLNTASIFALSSGLNIPNIEQVVQYLSGETEERDSDTYLIDSIGVQLRTVQRGVVTNTGAITQLQFADLTGLAIASFECNGTVVINGNNVNITGTEFSSVEFDDGSFYSLEFLAGSTIAGVQSCTVVGTYTTAESIRYKSYRNLSGYNEKETPGTGDPVYDGTSFTSGVTVFCMCWTRDGTQYFESTDDLGKEVKQYTASTPFDVTSTTLISELDIVIDGSRYIQVEDGKLFAMFRTSKSLRRYTFASGLIEDAVQDQSKTLLGASTTSIRGFGFSEDGLHMFYIYDRNTEKLASSILTSAFDLTTLSVLAIAIPAGTSFLDQVNLENDGSAYYTFDFSTRTVRKYLMSVAWDISKSDSGATYIGTVPGFDIANMQVISSVGVAYTNDNFTTYGLSVPSDIAYVPADPADLEKDVDGLALVYFGRARYDVLLDGTLRTEVEAPEIYKMSLLLTTNILYTGEVATAYEEALLEYNQDGAGVMFANITDYPTIGECLKYGTQQTEILTDGDLHNALDYVDALEVVKDSEGVTVTYSDGTPMTVIKTGVLV